MEKGKAEIITASGNFHGRTTTIVGFSDDPDSHDGFGPYVENAFPRVDFGDIDSLAKAITPHTAAFLVEPIQGEGGVVIPPAGYLKAAEKLCRENDILLICDEIQSGLGRSGKLFAFEYEDVRPDLVIIGKALSGGYYPVSAVLSSAEIMLCIKPGQHGSTFGGNPLAAAVAIAALDVLINEKLIERSMESGAYFMEKLNEIASDKIETVRGKGLWIGLVLKEKARPYCLELMKEGVLCKDTHGNIIRIAPPLTIAKEQIDMAVEKIAKVLAGS